MKKILVILMLMVSTMSYGQMTTVYFLDKHEKVVATVQYYGTDKAKVMEKAISDWKDKHKSVYGYYYAYIPKFKKKEFLSGYVPETSFKQDSITIAMLKLEAEYEKTDSEAEKREITKKIFNLRMEWLKELK